MSVAIRTATRIQDQDDFGSTPGAGNDGYALTWDNGAGEFVLTAAGGGVTDHGALTGLSDDDHSQYALLSGRSGGQTVYGGTAANNSLTLNSTSNATKGYILLGQGGGYVGIGTATPNEQLEITGNFRLPSPTSTVGAIYSGSSKIAHFYGTNNIFVGATSGNVTTTGTGGNVGIGTNALNALTTGNGNFALGVNALTKCDTGYTNLAIGSGALGNLAGGYLNVALGSAANAITSGFGNIAIGQSALNTATTCQRNIAVGQGALQQTTLGNSYNTAIGYAAGFANTTGTNNTFIGYLAGFSSTNNITNATAIGNGANVTASNALVLGNTSVSVGIGTTAPATTLHALKTDAVTNAVTNIVTVGHNTSGAAAAGFGTGLVLNAQSSTTAGQSAALIAASWIVATHASRTARLALSAYDYGGAREGVRIDTDGSAALLGFYGHAAVAQQVLATGAGATVDDIITALQNLGLVKQS